MATAAEIIGYKPAQKPITEAEAEMMFPGLVGPAALAAARMLGEIKSTQAADNARWAGMTTAQIEQEMRARTEKCMDDKKNDGYSWFNLFGNREENRGKCTAYARESLAEPYAAAQRREAGTLYAIDDAVAAQATKQADNKTVYLVIFAALAAFTLYLLFAK